jgi:peptidoglycan/LPS O-acetylase OafA/YrhL
MTHYAVLWMFGNYYTSHKVSSMQLTWIIVAGLILLTGAAYLIMVVYDIPVRKYLSNKRTAKRKGAPSGATLST